MWNVCWQCGEYRADKQIDLNGPVAICPECGYRHAFLRMPLLLVSGASGAGKTTVCQRLLGRFKETVLLDSDILWRPEFDTPENKYRAYFETWLRMCKNIGQAGRPVVLFGAGVGVPENLEQCVERRYFSTLHYLALTCEDEELVKRLTRRPAWRQANSEAFLDHQVQFNGWFKTQARLASPPVELLDTSGVSVETTTEQVASWIRTKIRE